MKEIPEKRVYMRCKKMDSCADAKRKINLTWPNKVNLNSYRYRKLRKSKY